MECNWHETVFSVTTVELLGAMLQHVSVSSVLCCMKALGFCSIFELVERGHSGQICFWNKMLGSIPAEVYPRFS